MEAYTGVDNTPILPYTHICMEEIMKKEKIVRTIVGTGLTKEQIRNFKKYSGEAVKRERERLKRLAIKPQFNYTPRGSK